MTTDPEVWTFFYGSYINLDVLRDVDYAPRRYETAWLPGFDITIRPLANLLRCEQRTVYGIVATGTHAELARLYDHAENVLGGRYLPEAVLVATDRPAAGDYVDRIIEPGKKHGFPRWYIDRLESFKA